MNWPTLSFLIRHVKFSTLLAQFFVLKTMQFLLCKTHTVYKRGSSYSERVAASCEGGGVSGVRHHRTSPACSVYCFQTLVLTEKFICSLMTACTAASRHLPRNTRPSRKSSDVFFKNVSDLLLRSSKIISRKGGCKHPVHWIVCALCLALRSGVGRAKGMCM